MSQSEIKQTCPRCHGTGHYISGSRCRICDGFGMVDDKKMNRYLVFEAIAQSNVRDFPQKVTPLGEGIEF